MCVSVYIHVPTLVAYPSVWPIDVPRTISTCAAPVANGQEKLLEIPGLELEPSVSSAQVVNRSKHSVPRRFDWALRAADSFSSLQSVEGDER